MNWGLVIFCLACFGVGASVAALWLDNHRLNRRIRQLERVFELLRNPTMRDIRTIEVPAGTAIKAGEAIFIAADGKAYPAGLKEEAK